MEQERLIDLLARLDRGRRRFPEGAACAACGEQNPLCLAPSATRPLCLQCARARRGLAPVDTHHLGGRPSPLTVAVPANAHAILTFLQEICRGTLEPASAEAQLLDLLLLRALVPSLGIEPL